MINNFNFLKSLGFVKGYLSLCIACVASVLFVSCSNQDDDCTYGNHLVDVNVNISCFSIVQSRATASEANVSTISFKAIDASGNVKAEFTQSSTETGFGNIKAKLKEGAYTFVAVASNYATAATITSASKSSIPTSGDVILYSATQEVTVSAGSNTIQTVNMSMGKRRNASFLIKITDTTPDDVASLQIIIAPGEDATETLEFNPATGLATSQWKYTRTIAKDPLNGNTFTDITYGYSFLIPVTETTLDVTINALSSSGTVLYTRTLKDVTFKQSMVTIATGTFFSTIASGSFTFDTATEMNNISLD